MFSIELREWEFVGKKILVSGDLRKCVNSFKNDPVKRLYEEDAYPASTAVSHQPGWEKVVTRCLVFRVVSASEALQESFTL